MTSRRAYIRTLATLSLLILGGCGRINYELLRAEDGGTSTDAAPDGAILSDCPGPDADTLALFTFNQDEGNSSLIDAVGSHAATIRRGAAVTVIPGPAGCGDALFFPMDHVAEIPDSPEWELANGSIDFWINRPSTVSDDAGIVSRDQNLTAAPGHISILMKSGGQIGFRIQNPGADGAVCSELQLPPNEWVHVGVNFGDAGQELWVNGEQQNGTGRFIFTDCGLGALGGIAGNDLPWFIGGSAAFSDPGELPGDVLMDGAIDHFRISRVPRDFSSYAP